MYTLGIEVGNLISIVLKKNEYISKVRVLLAVKQLRGRKVLRSSRKSTGIFITRNEYCKYLGSQNLMLL